MGTDFNIRPIGGSVVTAIAWPAPNAARTAVPTELPRDKAVSAADTSLPARNNPQANADQQSKQIVIDRAAAEIVYRVVDNRTSMVVRQFPDEARLRARAYLRAQDIAKQEASSRNTDREA
ncbi:hypothetical protein ASC80_02940 [Afipia sp. Root123D2]|nr:hypothetical protein [Afipia sp. Root123D2]KQW22365.1 hypothetical protein ASC80_02940 [Afipia sp. Root123D2]